MDGPDFLGWLNAPEGVNGSARCSRLGRLEKIAELGETLVIVGSGDVLRGAGGDPCARKRGGESAWSLRARACPQTPTNSCSGLLRGRTSACSWSRRLLSIWSGRCLPRCPLAADWRYGPRPGSTFSSVRRKAASCTLWRRRRAIPSLPNLRSWAASSDSLSPRHPLPMAAAGIEPLSVLEGAGQAYHDYDLRAFENPVWMYAGARHALELRARRTEFLGIFEPDCMALGRWWARSTARRSCRGGYGVLPVPAELPGALDTLDAMLDGSRSAFETFLRIPLPAKRRNIELDWKDYDNLGYLSGHSVGEAESAMFDALVQSHASLDIPLIVLSAEQLDAPQLGELFYFLELTAALCAAADGLNPFDRKRTFPTRAQAAACLQG